MQISILLLAICFTETGFNNVNNISDRNGGSYGICQMSLRTARSMNKSIDALALQQPDVNIMISHRYFESLKAKYKGNVRKSISAYNAGHYTSTNKTYVDKVIKNMVMLESEGLK